METVIPTNLFNGNTINDRATFQDLLGHEPSEQIRLLWSMCVSLSVRKADGIGFVIPPYQAICDDLEQFRGRIFEAYHAWRKRTELAADQADFQAGEVLYSSVKAAHLSALCLIMKPATAKGFISAMSAFNYFEPRLMLKAIDEIEALGIVTEMGNDNPNTGKACTAWQIEGCNCDYLSLRFDVSAKDTLAAVEAKRASIESILKKTNPDYVRYETRNWPTGSTGVRCARFVMFFD